jgi:AcrR family transcriptional regulator
MNDNRKSRWLSEDRRAQIIEVSLSIFAKKGYNGTKIREIAEKAEISEALLYKHFKTKEELYRVALGEHLDVHSMSIDCKEALANKEDNIVLSCFASHVIQYYRQDPRSIRLLLFSALEGSPIMYAFQPTKEKTTIEILANYIQQRVDEGAFKKVDALLTSKLFIEAMVMFVVDQEASVTMPPHSCSDKQAIETIVKIFMGGLKLNTTVD